MGSPSRISSADMGFFFGGKVAMKLTSHRRIVSSMPCKVQLIIIIIIIIATTPENYCCLINSLFFLTSVAE